MGAEAGATGAALVWGEVVAATAISVAFVGFVGSTSAVGSTNDTGTAVALENSSGAGPVCFKYGVNPRVSCAADKANSTAATVNFRYFNASMRAKPFQSCIGKNCRGLREEFASRDVVHAALPQARCGA